MPVLPAKLKQGEKARLFPIVAETSKEKRIVSTFLAVLPQVPDLASALFASAGQRIGKRTKIETYTEVVLQNGGAGNDRPDGFVRVKSGSKEWTALIEAKIGKAEIQEEQVSKYIELAKANGIDAVITLSNQFVARADHPPLKLPKSLLKKTSLFHWPWMWVLTKCQLLELEDAVSDEEQKFLLSEFIRFLEHSSTGVEGFNHMGKSWREIVRDVGAGASLKKSSQEVEDVVAAWIEEQRDLCLLMSRNIGKTVKLKMERKYNDDPVGRLKAEIGRFVDEKSFRAALQVPDTAADLEIEADLLRKCVVSSMKLKAPADKKSTKARVNWLLRMLKEDEPRIFVRALWPSRAAPTQASLAELRESPDIIQTENNSLVPHAFEVMLIEDLGGRFAGSRTFIEDVERIVPQFYDLVGQYLRAWQPPPPKPVAPKSQQAADPTFEQLDAE